MRSRNISHSKIKNAGILFEILVRQITTDVMEGKTESPALHLLKSYFHPTTELGKEVQLYHAFTTVSQLSEAKAIHFIDIITARRKALDEQALAKQKYELIKELKSAYNLTTLMSSRVPNYKVFASIYKTFVAESTKSNVSNIHDVIQSKFALIEHLSASKNKRPTESKIFETFKNQTEDLRLLTYKILIDKFNQKYSNLDYNQKALLREYINNVSNVSSLRTFVEHQVPLIKKELLNQSKVTTDKVTQIKLKEVANQLSVITESKFIKDKHISSMMIVYELLKELKGVQHK